LKDREKKKKFPHNRELYAPKGLGFQRGMSVPLLTTMLPKRVQPQKSGGTGGKRGREDLGKKVKTSTYKGG